MSKCVYVMVLDKYERKSKHLNDDLQNENNPNYKINAGILIIKTGGLVFSRRQVFTLTPPCEYQKYNKLPLIALVNWKFTIVWGGIKVNSRRLRRSYHNNHDWCQDLFCRKNRTHYHMRIQVKYVVEELGFFLVTGNYLYNEAWANSSPVCKPNCSFLQLIYCFVN